VVRHDFQWSLGLIAVASLAEALDRLVSDPNNTGGCQRKIHRRLKLFAINRHLLVMIHEEIEENGSLASESQSAAVDELDGNPVAAQPNAGDEVMDLLAGKNHGKGIVILRADLREDIPRSLLEQLIKEPLQTGDGLPDRLRLPKLLEFGPDMLAVLKDPVTLTWSDVVNLTPGHREEGVESIASDLADNLVALFLTADVSFGPATVSDGVSGRIEIQNMPEVESRAVTVAKFRPFADKVFAEDGRSSKPGCSISAVSATDGLGRVDCAPSTFRPPSTDG